MSIVRTQEGAALQILFCLDNYPSRELSTLNGSLPNFQYVPGTLYLQTSPKPLFIQFIRFAFWMNLKNTLMI